MPPRPPRILEAFFGFWIPPACREEVLGDLCEKYVSPAQYILLAILTIPRVIVSRARRVTETPVLFMEALLIFGCYLAAGFYRDSAFLHGPYGLLRAALPLVPFLLVMIAFDVYSTPAKTALHLAGRIACAALVSFLAMARFPCGGNSACLARTLPDWMNLLGSASALLLVTALRVLFRSGPGIEQSAGPAHWLKQTPAPVALPRHVWRFSAVVALTGLIAAILGVDVTSRGFNVFFGIVVFVAAWWTAPKRRE